MMWLCLLVLDPLWSLRLESMDWVRVDSRGHAWIGSADQILELDRDGRLVARHSAPPASAPPVGEAVLVLGEQRRLLLRGAYPRLRSDGASLFFVHTGRGAAYPLWRFLAEHHADPDQSISALRAQVVWAVTPDEAFAFVGSNVGGEFGVLDVRQGVFVGQFVVDDLPRRRVRWNQVPAAARRRAHPSHHPPISHLHADADHRLWLGLVSFEATRIWRVLDLEGDRLTSVLLERELRPLYLMNDQIWLWDGRQVLIVRQR